jgi:hypothetical protein
VSDSDVGPGRNAGNNGNTTSYGEFASGERAQSEPVSDSDEGPERDGNNGNTTVNGVPADEWIAHALDYDADAYEADVLGRTSKADDDNLSTRINGVPAHEWFAQALAYDADAYRADALGRESVVHPDDLDNIPHLPSLPAISSSNRSAVWQDAHQHDLPRAIVDNLNTPVRRIASTLPWSAEDERRCDEARRQGSDAYERWWDERCQLQLQLMRHETYTSFTEFLRYRAFVDWRATRGPLGSNHDQYGENDDLEHWAARGSGDGGYDERVSHALGSPLASILSHLDAQGTVPSTEQIRGLVDRFHDSDGNQSDGYEYDERAVYDNEPYGDYGDDGHYDDGYQSGDIMSDGYEYDERVEYDD